MWYWLGWHRHWTANSNYRLAATPSIATYCYSQCRACTCAVAKPLFAIFANTHHTCFVPGRRKSSATRGIVASRALVCTTQVAGSMQLARNATPAHHAHPRFRILDIDQGIMPLERARAARHRAGHRRIGTSAQLCIGWCCFSQSRLQCKWRLQQQLRDGHRGIAR